MHIQTALCCSLYCQPSIDFEIYQFQLFRVVNMTIMLAVLQYLSPRCVPEIQREKLNVKIP